MSVVALVADFNLSPNMNSCIDNGRSVGVGLSSFGLSGLALASIGRLSLVLGVGIGLAGFDVDDVGGDAGGEWSNWNAAATVVMRSRRVERHADLLLSASMIANGEGGGRGARDSNACSNDGSELGSDHDHGVRGF